LTVMLNKFEFVTSSPSKSFDSSMKQNVGQLLTVHLFSAVHRNVIRKRRVLLNMEPSESRKNDNFGKSSKFPGIPVGNFRDRRFPGIPENSRTGIPRGLGRL